jgi:putative solute:sodium symporter small subunit
MVGLCVFPSLIVPIFAGDLEGPPILGFPFDFYLAAQGAPIILVVLLAWFARRQNAIDGRHEDDGGEPWL